MGTNQIWKYLKITYHINNIKDDSHHKVKWAINRLVTKTLRYQLPNKYFVHINLRLAGFLAQLARGLQNAPILMCGFVVITHWFWRSTTITSKNMRDSPSLIETKHVQIYTS